MYIWLTILCGLLVNPFIPTKSSYASTLKCGVAEGFPPYQYQYSGRPTGLDVDVLQLVNKHLSEDISIYQAEWLEVLASVRFGGLDCVAGIEMNEDRKQFLQFTEPYYTRDAILVTLEGRSEINTLKDLHLKKVGSDLHSPIEAKLRGKHSKPVVRLVKVKSKDSAFDDLMAGRLDAVILPREVAFFLSHKNTEPIKIIGDSIDSIPVAFAVRKGNTRLLKKLGDVFQKPEVKAGIEHIVNSYLTQFRVKKLNSESKH